MTTAYTEVAMARINGYAFLKRARNYWNRNFTRPIKDIFSQPGDTKFKNRLENDGYCLSCNKNTTFVAENEWLRDFYFCTRCGSIPRERAVMYCIEKFFPDWRKKIIHESSPVARGTSLRLKKEAPNYFATQYFPGIESGKIYKGFRNENLEDLSFEDQSIDLHITQDVFEHIFDYKEAWREIARTLKPGGAHIFTTPLVNRNFPSEVCARIKPDGLVEHLIEPPEYHGNPVSKEGSLVTVRWGYDISKIIYEACHLFTEMVFIDSLDLGIRAEFIEVLITRK